MSSRRSSNSSWSSLKAFAKEHHAAMNGAHDLYRGGPRLAHSTKAAKEVAVTTHDLSSDESLAKGQPLTKTPSRRVSQAWKELKTMAKEHHEGMNAAYSAYYGLGAYKAQVAKEMGLRTAN